MTTKTTIVAPAEWADIKAGDTVRVTHPGGDSTATFRVDRVDVYAGSPNLCEVTGNCYAEEEGWKLERLTPIPTEPGLYRIRSMGASFRGLALDKSGQWWWYDLTSSTPFSPATQDEVVGQVPRLVLVDAWEGAKG